MTACEQLLSELKKSPRTWLITGAAGFIGSNLLETLLLLEQRVVGLDNFSTGRLANLDQVRAAVLPERWERFRFIRGDITDAAACRAACAGVDYVLHHAALGSVPRSLAEPVASHQANATGFLLMLLAAQEAKVKRFVYASSSAVYGDHPQLPKVEDRVGNVLSPYAATKVLNEVYAGVWALTRALECVGLRYFNVFGPRQDPEGTYAAVIPRWIATMLRGEPVQINGDGGTSRDFCHVANTVQANLLAATTANPAAVNQVYNIAVGERTTLNELFQLIRTGLRQRDPSLAIHPPVYREFRPGDVRHSHADIGKAMQLLGYAPTHRIASGLEAALDWYRANAR